MSSTQVIEGQDEITVITIGDQGPPGAAGEPGPQGVPGPPSPGGAAIGYVDAGDAASRDRANHTGTQPAATISDFSTAADARIALQKGAVDGLATLGSDSKISSAQLPDLAITDTNVVGSQAAMLALTAEVGDVAVRTDLNKSFILQTAGAATLSNWQELLTPTDAVSSINGRSGTVTGLAEDAAVLHTTGAENVAGIKSFSSSPVVPMPLDGTDVANKAYVDSAASSATVPDATSSVKGKLQLAGDLAGTASSPTVPGLAGKEPTLSAGATGQYYRGDKSWQTLDQDAVPDGTTNKAYSAAEKTKLSGIATGATANDSDANLKARASHTGTQTASTISDFNTAVATTAAVKSNNLSDLASVVTARTNLGLGSVDNTADTNKPLSTATSTALALKAALASPVLTGTPTAPTAALGTNSTQIATTAYADASTAAGTPDATTLVKGKALLGAATGAATFESDALKATLASPTLTGTPTAPTATPGANSTQVATTAYADAAVQAMTAGLDWKTSVRAATTANGTLASAYANGLVIDGVTLATGNRILLKNQTTSSENGIYVVSASGAPTRSSDANSGTNVSANLSTFVEEGTANADTGWTLTNNGAITVGTSALTFTQFSGATTPAATASTLGTVELNTDLGGGATAPQVVATHLAAALPVAQGGTGVTGSTGSGNNVLSTSPVLTSPTGIVKNDVGLGNVDNTSDVNKPVSTAQATANALKVAKAGDTMTGDLNISGSGGGGGGKIISPTGGAGLYLAGIGSSTNKAELRIVGNDNAWSDDAFVAYFQADYRGAHNLIMQSGTYGADSALNRVLINASYLQIDDGNYDPMGFPTARLDIGPAQAAKAQIRLRSGVAPTTPNDGDIWYDGTDLKIRVTSTTYKLVSDTATQTLTNKTLTSPVVSTPTGIVKGDVGLGNVDNTADTAKPVSTAQQTALNLKAPLAGPSFTGNPSAPTASQGMNTTQLATTAYVDTGLVAKVTGPSSATDNGIARYNGTTGKLIKDSSGITISDPNTLAIVRSDNSTTSKGISISHTGIAITGYAGWFSKTGSGTTNYGIYATASGGTTSYAAWFDAGNVGIGVSTPAHKLDVTGDINASSTITGSNLSGTNTGDQTNITGNAATVSTNANLTGPITSSGNASSIASQTGTGSKIVVDTSPALAGTPTAPTATQGTNTTQLATTAFVLANGATTPDADAATKGKVQLANDLGGTAALPTVVATHLAAALPVVQGGTGVTTKTGTGNAVLSISPVLTTPVIDQFDSSSGVGAAWSSFTPTIGSVGGTITTKSGTGTYKQIGKTVHWHANLTITTNGTGSGAVTMTLPVTSAASVNMNLYGREDGISGKMLQGFNSSTTLLSIFDYANAYPGVNGAILRVSGTYEAA